MKLSLALLAAASVAGAIEIPFSHYTFDEGSGAVAYDTGTRGAVGNATIVGATWVNTAQGGALFFDGNDYVYAANAIPSGTKSYTIQATVLFTEKTQWATIVKNWGSFQAGSFHFGLDGNSGKLSNYIGTSPASAVIDSNPISLNVWHVLSVSYDGNVGGSNLQRLYVDGQLVASSSAVGTVATFGTRMVIGAKSNDAETGIASVNPGWLKGYIADLQFYTTEVAPSPIPEPSTYGVALGGLALVGAIIRRRKISK